MKYKVNLGSISIPKFSIFDNLVEAKKAIREKLKTTFGKGVYTESCVSVVERGTYGLGYRIRTGARTYTSGIYKIQSVKEDKEEVKK